MMDEASYREWRIAKLESYPNNADELLVEIGGLADLSATERAAIRANCTTHVVFEPLDFMYRMYGVPRAQGWAGAAIAAFCALLTIAWIPCIRQSYQLPMAYRFSLGIKCGT
jgi:hypothetical protein